jgi:hypothetical protein
MKARIVVEINGKEIALSMDEARELYRELSKIMYAPAIPSPLFTDYTVTCNSSDYPTHSS